MNLLPTHANIDQVSGWLALKLLTGKVSKLLVNQLAYGLINRTLHVHVIYDEIGMLEGAPYSRSSNTKPASKLLRRPLKGLWHKHYTEPSHILRNIGNHWGKNFPRFTLVQDEILKGNEPGGLTPEIFGRLTHAFVMGAHTQRNKSRNMTGEWIVYAIHNDKKHYLSLGKHAEDNITAAKVRECAAEFPELTLEKYI